ncbi:MAG TPA: VOC family protein [Rhizomicrobium sp.]|jgi:predicted 3-demethylubiquinone-9 3-methyltransferase (glyoxalase superfamily)
MIKSITPFLWFDTQAEDAAKYYVSLFPNSRILQTSHYGDFMPNRAGQVMVVELELLGQRLTFMNGGPNFKLDEAFSLSVACEDQAEIDRLWAALGDKPSACGWTRDKFGVVWQINYAGLPQLMTSQERINKVMAAMMTMVKIDIQPLKDAVS